MGTFFGHAIVATGYSIIGVWWLLQTIRRYCFCRSKKLQFQTSLHFYSNVSPKFKTRRIPFETRIITAVSLFGGAAEIVAAFMPRFYSWHLEIAQHTTLYLSFSVWAFFSILTLKGYLPKGSDYVSLIIILCLEATMMLYHSIGCLTLEKFFHNFGAYITFITCFVIGLEAAYRTEPLLPLLRAKLVLLKACLWWETGFVLFNPFPGTSEWDQESHRSIMLAAVILSWCLAGILGTAFAIGCFFHRYYGGPGRLDPYFLLAQGEEGEFEEDEEEEEEEKLEVKKKKAESCARHSQTKEPEVY